jgi:hypothetical protein
VHDGLMLGVDAKYTTKCRGNKLVVKISFANI